MVSHIRSDESALYANLEGQSVEDTLCHCKIAEQCHEPVVPVPVSEYIYYRQRRRYKRHDHESVCPRNPAFPKHQEECQKRAGNLPRHNDVIDCRIAVFLVAPLKEPLICGKDEDLLMQVVRYHEQEEKQCHAPENQCFLRNPPVDRLPERQCDDHSAHRDEQHGKIVEIPHIPDSEPYRQHVEFESPDDQPEQYQPVNADKIPSHHLMYYTAFQCDPPREEEPHVQNRAYEPERTDEHRRQNIVLCELTADER